MTCLASIVRVTLNAFVLIAVGFSGCVFATTLDSATLTVNGGITTLSVESGRPVAKVVETLIQKYGYVITYEDPRYSYVDDLQDVGPQFRRNAEKNSMGKVPPIIVPLGGKLTVSSSSTDAPTLLNQLVREQSTNSRGAHFRVEHTGDFFHVIPTETRNGVGNWAIHNSVLDVFISLPTAERTDYEMIDAICAAVSSAAKIKVVAATDILRMGLRSDETGPPKYSLGAENERARTVLMRVLAQIAPDRGRISWLLFYSNEERSAEYVLNLMPVPNQSSSTIGQRTAPAPVKSH